MRQERRRQERRRQERRRHERTRQDRKTGQADTGLEVAGQEETGKKDAGKNIYLPLPLLQKTSSTVGTRTSLSMRPLIMIILTNPDPESLKKILFSPSAYNIISLLRFLLKEAFM